MKTPEKELGKVSITIEKDFHNSNKTYERLTVVKDKHSFATYISRKNVPEGEPLENNPEYWIRFGEYGNNKLNKEYSVVFGRAIPINSVNPGMRYYFSDFIKIKKLTEEQIDIIDDNIWERHESRKGITDYYVCNIHGVINIPKDFDVNKFLTDIDYIKSLFKYNRVDGIKNLNCKTNSPNFIIRNGKLICIKQLNEKYYFEKDYSSDIKELISQAYYYRRKRHKKTKSFEDKVVIEKKYKQCKETSIDNHRRKSSLYIGFPISKRKRHNKSIYSFKMYRRNTKSENYIKIFKNY